MEEERFVARLRENLAAVEGAGCVQASDNLPELRKLTGGRLLRSELESEYPLGKSLSMRIAPKIRLFGKEKQPSVLTGRVVLRLERFVEKRSDDEPVSLGELTCTLAKESDLANRNRYELFLGLYSPTGWADDARAFVENEPPGSGWASNRVCPVLVGPEIAELAWDRKSDKLARYVHCFCGLTLQERKRICRNELQRAILVQEFANLEKIAQTSSLGLDFVKRTARELASGSKDLAVARVSGVGLVLKKKI